MYNSRLSFIAITIVLFMLLKLSGCSDRTDAPFECSDQLGCVTVEPEEPIRLGVLQALSGSIAPLGKAQIRGLELALDKRDNKLLGHPVSLQIEDTGCSAEGGANAALKLISDPQTVAIFGTTCSGAAATAAKAMSAAGLVMVSGNNSAPFLTSMNGSAAPNWQAGYFRTANNEENAGRTAAEYAHQILGVRNSALIHDNDIYTIGLVDSYRSAFEELGGRVVLYTAINKGDTEMGPVLEAVINSGAELLFFPLFPPEGEHLLKKTRTMSGLSNTILMSDGALILQTFLDTVGEYATGMYFVGPSRPSGPKVDKLDLLYNQKYGEKPVVSYYITGYDAADLLLSAIEKAAVREESGKLHIGHQQLRDILYGTKDFAAVSGTLNCDKFGDCGQPVFNVLRLDSPELGVAGLEANIVYSSGR